MKKWLSIVVLLAIVLSAGFASADGSTEPKHIRAGFGLGIPYGVIGGNLEVSPIDHLALTAGLGITPGGPGWSIGGRAYLFGKDKTFRPRLSLLHGVVAVLETRGRGSSTYETITGNAFGIGFEAGGFDFDLIFPSGYDMPAGAVEEGSDVKISFGYGYHF